VTTKIENFFADLDGGVFEEKIIRAISDVAAAVIDNNKAGKISISLDFKRIGSSSQVTIDHKLVYVKPTSKGKASEENTTQTPMHVGARGKVTLFPEDQHQLFDKNGSVKANQE
jgi:hypothetical protein